MKAKPVSIEPEGISPLLVVFVVVLHHHFAIQIINMSLFNAKMSSSLLLLGLLLWPGLFVPADGLGDGRNVYRTRKCMSRECKAATQDIYDALDTAADPCDDFFRFTCGKWNDRNPHSNDNKFDYKVRWETLDKNMSVKMIKVLRPVAKAGVERPTAVQFVMDLFNFCVTEGKFAVEHGIRLIDRIFIGSPSTKEGREVGGSNPLQVLMQNNLELLSSSATNKVDWMRAVIETMVATSVNPLFVVTTEAIGNKINLKVTCNRFPVIILMKKLYFSLSTQFAAPAFAKEYAQFKFDEQLARNQTKKGILEKFGAPLRAISDYEQIVDDFVAVEQQLAFAALHSQTRDKIDLDSLDDLNTRTGNLADWTDFANRLLKAWKLPATVTKEDVVSVVDVQYLGEMLKVVTNGTAIEKLVNYLSFAIYKSYDPYLVKPGQNIAEVCYGHVEAFTWVLVRLYVDNYVYRESKIIVTDIAEKIRQTFVDIIRKKRWLDRVDRDRLVNKMKKIRLVIGYPQMIMVDAMLDSFYGIASMHLDNTSYVLTVAQVKATLARSKLARLHNPTDDVDRYYHLW